MTRRQWYETSDKNNFKTNSEPLYGFMPTVSFDLGLFYFAMFSILSASKSNNTQTVRTVSPNVLMQIRGHCKLNNGKSANPKLICLSKQF